MPTKNKQDYWCRLQIDGIKGKTIEKKILKIVKDWEEAGCGTDPENKERMLMFSRVFESKNSWLVWAKDFPFALKEATSTGKYRNIKTKKGK